jgi:hypothetical protein
VPMRMRERYLDPQKPKDATFEIVSDYSNFRRFEVRTDEHIDLPK